MGGIPLSDDSYVPFLDTRVPFTQMVQQNLDQGQINRSIVLCVM